MTPDVRDAAWNAVAVASLAYREELDRLRYVLDLAASKGLTVADLCSASGLDEPFITGLRAQEVR